VPGILKKKPLLKIVEYIATKPPIREINKHEELNNETAG
jgi:hypothetical protein